MNPSGFSRVENQLRMFFARCCDELSAHQPDRMDRFVRRCFREPRPRIQSLEDLQYNDYCRILRENLRADPPPGRTIRLFERHEVGTNVPPDIRYCSDLRNKYAHLRGTGDVSAREQFSDLVIVRRAVGALAQLRRSDEDARKLVQELDVCLNELITLLSESSSERSATPASDNPGEAERAPDVPAMLRTLEQSMSSKLALMAERLDRLPEDLALIAMPPGESDDETSRSIESLVDRLSELMSQDNQARDRMLALKPISPDEARENLIALRKRIWEETDSGPSPDGLLRKSNLEAFLEHRPRTEDEARKGPMKLELRSVAPEQRSYLTDVLSIVRRVERSQ